MVSAVFTAVYVDDLKQSRAFYSELFNLVPVFDSDWIVQLASPTNESVTITLQPRNHDLVPATYKDKPAGVSVAFVVEDCDALYRQAQVMGLTILQPPKNEIYGQRRFLTLDPDGLLIDVSSPCEPSDEFRARYMEET